MNRTLKTAVFLCATVLLTACLHKELCDHHPHIARIRVNADWSLFTQERPSGMTVLMYPAGGGSPVRRLTNTISHAYVNLPVGTYHSLLYNQSEAEFGSISFHGMDDYATAEVRLRDETRVTWHKSFGTRQRVATEPEWFAVSRLENLSVTQEMVDFTGAQLMAASTRRTRLTVEDLTLGTHSPQNVVYTGTVTLHISGFHNLRAVRGTLSGLAEGYLLASGRYSSTSITQVFEEWVIKADEADPTKGTATISFLCLGLPEGHTGTADENTLDISMLLVDNKTKVDYTSNVGDQITENEVNLSIDISVTVPEPLPDVKPEGGSGSGFNATVDDWGEEVDYDIVM